MESNVRIKVSQYIYFCKKKSWYDVSYPTICMICSTSIIHHWWPFSTLRQRQNGCHFADDIFKCIFFHENVWISLKISLKFVPKVQINNDPALVQIMAWQVTSHYLNPWWLVYWRIYASLRLSELTHKQLEMHSCITRVRPSVPTVLTCVYCAAPVSYENVTFTS